MQMCAILTPASVKSNNLAVVMHMCTALQVLSSAYYSFMNTMVVPQHQHSARAAVQPIDFELLFHSFTM
jgi:hypothetical protein